MSKEKNTLSIRMKEFYENRAKTQLIRRMPVAIRIDGRAFHTFTKNFQKPFDEIFMKSMQETMKYLCENIQGCVLGYTQSDEITLILTDYKKYTSDAFFNYEVQKVCSIAASMATMAFNKAFVKNVSEIYKNRYKDKDKCLMPYDLYNTYQNAIDKGAMFDARCFNIPKEEVTNLLYWRQQDASKNSVSMAASAYFSHNELQEKTTSERQEMLFSKGINWNDYPTTCKRGSCCIKNEMIMEPYGFKMLCKDVPDGHWFIDTEIPIFKGDGRAYIENRINFIKKEEFEEENEIERN